jgi:hypothetical protein
LKVTPVTFLLLFSSKINFVTNARVSTSKFLRLNAGRRYALEADFNAGVEAGYHKTADVNGYRQEGFGPFDSQVHHGRRMSASRAYLRPALRSTPALKNDLNNGLVAGPRFNLIGPSWPLTLSYGAAP